MRLLIISDIHSNIDALRAIEKDAGPVDRIYCAGDYVDYGTDPHEAIAWVRDHGVKCVGGNHDANLLRVAASGEAELLRGTKDYRWVHDNIDRMRDEDFEFLRTLPVSLAFSADGIDYLMRHQMKDNSYDVPQSLEQFDACWQKWNGGECSAGRMIFGHTHRRCVHYLDDRKLWLNPGSVSYRRPDDNDKRAHYMLITDGEILFRAVPYNRRGIYGRVLDYEKRGAMAEDQIRVARFFFGPAETDTYQGADK